MTKFRITLGPRFKYFWWPMVITIWTILQSLVHAWWVYFGRGMVACQMQVKRRLDFYLYMTYLYSNECDSEALDSYALLNFTKLNDLSRNTPTFFNLKRMFKDDGTMTECLMDMYLGSDAIWIIASVGLLLGILMRLKQGSALIFYIPWILITFIILAMDLFSALYYALRLPSVDIKQTPFRTWKLDPVAIMAIMCGRLGLIWLLNVSNMVYIIWFTRVSYNQRYSGEYHRRTPKMRRQETENRIKNWQLFYGAIEESGAHAGNLNGNQKSTFIDDEDFNNYTSTFKELEDYNYKRRKFEGSAEHELCSTFKSSSSVQNDGVSSMVEAERQKNEQLKDTREDHHESKKKVHITELVSHLPWSYIDSKKNIPAMLSPLHEYVIKDGDVNEKDLKPKRVIVVDPSKNSIRSPENEHVSRF